MGRSSVVAAVFLAIAAGAAGFLLSRPPAVEPRPDAGQAAAPPGSADGVRVGARPDGDRHSTDVDERLRLLEARLAEETAERRHLEERLETVTAQLEGLGIDPNAMPDTRADANPAPAAETSAGATAEAPPAGADTSAMERALAAAGVDASAAAEIKHRHDALAMSEMYLRDQATREQWLDSPRFSEEMAALSAQETSIRDEIGDDAYDRYLFALGETNRVRVEDVLSQSPAAQAGLQPGDMIVRYGDDRIFAPGDLVAQTRGGTAGEPTRLEIIRNGQLLAVEVPRGPLGLRIGATQATPETG